MVKRSSRWNTTLLAVRDHVLAQGEVVYAYNLLQEKFFSIFLTALMLQRFGNDIAITPEFYSYALALWHVAQSDHQQRNLAFASISKVPTNLRIKPGIERLEWAKKTTDKLAAYRNIVAHTPVTFFPEVRRKHIIGIPKFGGISMRAVHADRLRQIKGLRFWKTVRDDFLKLGEYVEFVNRQILTLDYQQKRGPVVGMRRAWPSRPRLRSLGPIQKLEARMPKAVAAPRQARRPPSRQLP
jgi:hypothetical protein